MFFLGLFGWLFAIIATGAILYGGFTLLYRFSRVFRNKLEAFYATLPQEWEDSDDD